MSHLVLQATGSTHRVDGGTKLTVGRRPASGLVVADRSVSADHALIEERYGVWHITDLISTNGTDVNGHRIDSPTPLSEGDLIRVGDVDLRVAELAHAATGSAPPPPPRSQPRSGHKPPPKAGRTRASITIGSAPDNTLVIGDDATVQPYHVVAVRVPGGMRVCALGSAARLVVRGQQVKEAQVQWSESFTTGKTSVRIDDSTGPVRAPVAGPVMLQCDGVTVWTQPLAGPHRQLLAPASLAFRRGELVAIIGGIGAGKSTLLKVLAGVFNPNTGSVTVGGHPVESQATSIGYVPQHAVTHDALKPIHALRYGARLRLPAKCPPAARTAAADTLIRRIQIASFADRPIKKLSGGQQKSVSVAMELLGDPPVLLLDEPAAGLHPSAATRQMRMLRALADDSRTVVVVTHLTRDLDLCDKIVVMGPGGVLSFVGSPNEVRDHFQTPDIDEVYEELDRQTPPDQGTRARGPVRVRRPPYAGPSGRRRDLAVIVKRSLRLLVSDRTSIAGPLLLAFLSGVALGLPFNGQALRSADSPGDSATIVFIMSLIASLLSGFLSSTMMFNERDVTLREVGRGMSPGAFVTGRLLVLGTLSALLGCAVVLGTLLCVGSQRTFGEHLTIMGFVALGTVVSSATGALVAWVAPSDRLAAVLSVIAVVPQIIFAGVLISLKESCVPYFVSARWVVAAAGSRMDLDDGPTRSRELNEFYGPTIFDTSLWLAAFVLIAMVVLLGVLTTRQLIWVSRRRSP